MSAEDADRLREPVARLRAALLNVSPTTPGRQDGCRPDPNAGAYFAELLERDFRRVELAEGDDARVLALSGLNPARSALEDHGLLFARSAGLADAHHAVDVAVADLIAPFC